LQAFFARLRAWALRSPLEASLALAALGVTLYVLALPLTVSRYVPMTDLPFHATQGATFRHYWDRSFHLFEQFELRPFAVPYMSMYALIAALMLVFSMAVAVKISIAIMLGLVPAGLAVLFHGAKKSPLLGLLGLGLCWSNLTHWGFLNYMGALGLFSMVIGATMLLVDRPTLGRKLGLIVALVALYFTHVFRFPFALAAVAGTAIVMYPATRRLRPVLVPLLVGLAIFALWWKVRPPTLAGKIEFGFHPDRITKEYGGALYAGFKTDDVKDGLMLSFDTAWGVALVCGVAALIARRKRYRRFRAWEIGAALAPLACAAVFFALFLILPLWIGGWWYVYPREATAATLILCGACPDLPRARWLRVLLVAAMSLPPLLVARRVAKHYAEFAPASEDFHRITRKLPKAPKLFYMIFDHNPTSRASTPYIHLPAYVQAEKGGWLSWHFAIWNSSPVAYRPKEDPISVVVPRTPPRWEWTPQQFKIEMTPFFDWFLVRQPSNPSKLFEKDPEIVLVDHVGMWWLYKRAPKK
jgi:hypothetical protein